MNLVAWAPWIVFAGVPILAFLALVVIVLRTFRRKAHAAGSRSLGEYLRAVPRTDAERADAVDLALKGLVICLLGLILAPLLVIGVFPLFYGARKVAYGSLGLGLVDDPDPNAG